MRKKEIEYCILKEGDFDFGFTFHFPFQMQVGEIIKIRKKKYIIDKVLYNFDGDDSCDIAVNYFVKDL